MKKILKFLQVSVTFFLTLCSFCIAAEEYQVFYFNNIPGCSCFKNCRCLTSYWAGSIVKYSHCENYHEHSSKKSDILWHVFLDKLSESWNGGPSIIYINDFFCLNSRKFNMLSDYLNAVEDYKLHIEREANKDLKSEQTRLNKLKTNKFFKFPELIAECERYIDKKTNQLFHSLEVLSSIPGEIIPLYQQIIASCPHKGPYNLALTYNQGLLGFITGDYEASLEKINEFVVFAQTSGSQESLLNSKIYQTQGESLLEVGLYHEAIAALTKAIEKDPANKEAYFSRAAAHFETGDFDLAVFDYMSSEAKKNLVQVEAKVSGEFSSALIGAVLEGGKESAIEFVPSLCSTAYGLGECLWSFAQQPQDITMIFCNACYEAGSAVTEYIKNLDQEKIEGLADEILQVYQKFDSLNDAEKGQAIGYCVGKYGVDIFAGGATVKCFSAVKNLKNANRLCNLESMAASEANRKTITAAAIKHAADRESFFINVKIQWDKQNKHIIGKHNFEVGKSFLTNKDPENLLNKHAGKGKKVRGNIGEPGYQEIVDFGEHIGYNVDQNGIETLTTWGKVHYSKDGAHIVPTFPRK